MTKRGMLLTLGPAGVQNWGPLGWAVAGPSLELRVGGLSHLDSREGASNFRPDLGLQGGVIFFALVRLHVWSMYGSGTPCI